MILCLIGHFWGTIFQVEIEVSLISFCESNNLTQIDFYGRMLTWIAF